MSSIAGSALSSRMDTENFEVEGTGEGSYETRRSAPNSSNALGRGYAIKGNKELRGYYHGQVNKVATDLEVNRALQSSPKRISEHLADLLCDFCYIPFCQSRPLILTSTT